MRIAFAVMLALAGCALGDDIHGAERIVMWSHVGTSDSIGVPGPVACTATISHPCALVMYTTRLTLRADGAIVWHAAVGGIDAIGVPAEQREPVIDLEAQTPDGDLLLGRRGDDAGLRHQALLLHDDADGWSGRVSWSLFTVPGVTTFDVSIDP